MVVRWMAVRGKRPEDLTALPSLCKKNKSSFALRRRRQEVLVHSERRWP
jgi:hypothetical protein